MTIEHLTDLVGGLGQGRRSSTSPRPPAVQGFQPAGRRAQPPSPSRMPCAATRTGPRRTVASTGAAVRLPCPAPSSRAQADASELAGGDWAALRTERDLSRRPNRAGRAMRHAAAQRAARLSATDPATRSARHMTDPARERESDKTMDGLIHEERRRREGARMNRLASALSSEPTPAPSARPVDPIRALLDRRRERDLRLIDDITRTDEGDR